MNRTTETIINAQDIINLITNILGVKNDQPLIGDYLEYEKLKQVLQLKIKSKGGVKRRVIKRSSDVY